MNQPSDIDEEQWLIEGELAELLQKCIWEEIVASTGQTKQDYDNEIIQQIIKAHVEWRD